MIYKEMQRLKPKPLPDYILEYSGQFIAVVLTEEQRETVQNAFKDGRIPHPVGSILVSAETVESFRRDPEFGDMINSGPIFGFGITITATSWQTRACVLCALIDMGIIVV